MSWIFNTYNIKYFNNKLNKKEKILKNILYSVLVLVLFFFILKLSIWLFLKCDTRSSMTDILIKTTKIFKQNKIEYWLDKGTLLGVYRENGDLIPWEYDIDLGVLNTTCDNISKLKNQFKKYNLLLYDRNDYIPHKSKLTYDTENHHFYWSDPYLHDPCIRIYNINHLDIWVDIYWYISIKSEDVLSNSTEYLIPDNYDFKDSLLCCSEGIKTYTEQKCCGGCVPSKSLLPVLPKVYQLLGGIQYIPNNIENVLTIQYGKKALTDRQIKGWKGIVCGYWIYPITYKICLFVIILFILLFIWYIYNKRNNNIRNQYKRGLSDETKFED